MIILYAPERLILFLFVDRAIFRYQLQAITLYRCGSFNLEVFRRKLIDHM